jgi:hypothetical protein
MNQPCEICHQLPEGESACEQFYHVEVFVRTTLAQNTTNMLVDSENTMNQHGGHHHTTAAMVPHSQVQCAETLVNRLCNNDTWLKLEHLMINITV